ncbi:MAG: MOSC domain-containing protein [Bacteroidota bacterium]
MIDALLNTLPQTGSLKWIGLRPGHREDMVVVPEATAEAGVGLQGDRYQNRKGGSGKRQVTLIQEEHLTAVASMLGVERVVPELVRRNLLVSGINLLALKDRQFQIGDEVIFEWTGLCHPCSRMEEHLGAGGYNAMRGHGGITARVIQGGIIKMGDPVKMLAAATSGSSGH